MYTNPFKTTACTGFMVEDTIKAIKKEIIGSMIIEGQFKTEVGQHIIPITALNPDVPAFVHPLPFEFEGQNYIAIDLRPSTSISRSDGELKVRAKNEYIFSRIRAILSWRFSDGEPRDLMAMGPFPLKVFAHWIVDPIVKKMNLDPQVQVNMVIIAIVYYHMLFEDGKLDSRSVQQMALRIGRIAKIDPGYVMELIEKIEPPKNIGEFCEQVKLHAGTSRLEKLTPGLLFVIIGGTWFGVASKEVIAVATEHPPTFLAMLFMVSTDRSYRKSQLAQMVERFDRPGEPSQEYAKAIARLVKAFL